jgi:hypothetical protein
MRASRLREPVRFEPLSFYTGLLRSPFRSDRSARSWRRATMIGVSQVANAAGFYWQRLTS